MTPGQKLTDTPDPEKSYKLNYEESQNKWKDKVKKRTVK
jgi:hypothetical protein